MPNKPALRKPTPVRKVKQRKKRRKWPFVVLGIPLLVWLGVVLSIFWSTHSRVFTNPDLVPSKPVVIVLGAGLSPNGKPSLVLQDRLDGAIQLYKLGRTHRMMMSGDNRFANYNEPEAMRLYAVSHGVDDQDIILDFAGRDTYDTCFRAKRVFGFDKAIFVTQMYHAPRALYLARALGIDAVAYAVPNLDRYPGLQFSYSSREYVADIKAWWDVNVSHRKPYVDARKG